MEIRFRNIFYTLGIILFQLSCNTSNSNSNKGEGVELIKYAKLLSIKETADSFFVKVRLSTGEFERYTFDKNPENSFKRLVSLSSVFSGFICEIKAQETIIGVDNINYISNPILLERAKLKTLHSVGLGERLNIEKVISLNPDLIIHSGIGESNDLVMKKLNEFGIPFFLCNNYLEEDPLGRAEWIKVFGIICGKKEIAFELFEKIKKNYFQLKSQKFATSPTVLIGSIFGGIWDVPGGQSYSAKLIEDAGGNYLWKNYKQAGRLPLSLESVVKIGLDADIWINPGAHISLENMSGIEPRYQKFKAFQNGKVYNNNKQLNGKGGNAFWETGPVRPDLVLRDLIKIFHPNSTKEKGLVYYQKLR